MADGRRQSETLLLYICKQVDGITDKQTDGRSP